MKALVYDKAHSLGDFAVKLAETPEPILREFDVLADVHRCIWRWPSARFSTGMTSRAKDALSKLLLLVAEGRILPIVTTRLTGLTPEMRRAAHDLLESGSTIGKVVIATD